MKQTIYLLLVFSQVSIGYTQNSKEDFENFFFAYMTCDSFQLERTIFPLPYIHWRDDTPGPYVDTILFTKEEWKCERFYADMEYYPTFYDNFDKKRKKIRSDEVVLNWSAVGIGLNTNYYFKRIKGKWFLIKKDNFST